MHPASVNARRAPTESDRMERILFRQGRFLRCLDSFGKISRLTLLNSDKIAKKVENCSSDVSSNQPCGKVGEDRQWRCRSESLRVRTGFVSCCVNLTQRMGPTCDPL